MAQISYYLFPSVILSSEFGVFSLESLLSFDSEGLTLNFELKERRNGYGKTNPMGNLSQCGEGKGKKGEEINSDGLL
jgi:hypothetical protein